VIPHPPGDVLAVGVEAASGEVPPTSPRLALEDGMGAWLSVRAGVWIGDGRAKRHLELIAKGGDLYTDAYREALA